MEVFIFVFLGILFNIIGYEYLVESGESIVVLFNVFEIINISILIYYWKKNVKLNFIFVYLFFWWFVYNSLGLIRMSYIKKYTTEELWISYSFLIVSTLLLQSGILISRNIKATGYSFIANFKISKITYYIVSLLYLAFVAYTIVLGGGITAFFLADYQDKGGAENKTLLFVLTGFFTCFKSLNLPYYFSKDKNDPSKLVVYSYFLLLLIMSVASGSSLGIMGLGISMLFYRYLSISKEKELSILKKYIYFMLGFGLIAGMLIRFNRNNYSEFSFDVLKDAKENVFSSPTFDSTGNLIYIYNNLDPIYQPNQMIYPFVNFLPRATFTWKPMELGRILSYKLYGFESESIGGFAPTPMGEFYYDFGLLGVFLGMIVLGYAIGLIQYKINATPESKWRKVFLVTIAGLTATLPAWYTGFGVRLVYFILFMWVVIKIEKVYSVLRFK
ncbi:O-antigen polymerase [Flavobacterium sp. RS13.1]|uniref:O-antigen polymerase n=1 Tax=Flavobacterium sp. RS13.1 TaxID=3400345 RepID=UPI003AB0F86E